MPKENIREINGDSVFRTLSLVLTKACNLNCIYCYEKHNLRDKKVMDLSVAQKYIKQYMELEDNFNGIQIEFFGGEPFLAFHLIKNIVEWFKSQKWNKPYIFLIGTNGTILNDDIKNWLYENRRYVTVALSIDGNKTAHNINRSNSYDIVIKNLPFFKKYWPGQPAKMTISDKTIPYVADSIIELEEMGLFFTANVGFEDIWGDQDEKKRLLEIYELQLSQLVDYYLERSDLFPVSPILTAIPEYLGIPDYGKKIKKVKKRFCGAGHGMTAVDINGNNYPCHRFLPWITGKKAPTHEVNCIEAWKPEKCSQCKLILSCPTCAGFNWEINGDDGVRTTFHCESYKLEVLASCRLEAIKLSNSLSNLDNLSLTEKKQIKKRIEAIFDLIENGI
ncbi:MAG: 4Fe-4S cluster-binding domain-containing protein [Candidatus Aminicenantes bacterium]|nr:MAG: 4Fe-4S cluster-binding domain-containing protein [Candidatus Aminicenantes bacterium]